MPLGTINVLDPSGDPVELGLGRGDLRYSSVPVHGGLYGLPGAIQAVGDITISYSQLFAGQSRVGAAVLRMLAYAARVPLKAYRRTGDDSRERLRVGDHPIATAILDPWEGGSQLDLIEAILGPRLIHGNALLEVDEGARGVIRFNKADWRFSRPLMPFRGSIAGWVLDRDDESTQRTVGADKVLHVATYSPFGPVGVSPLQQLGTTLNIEDAAQKYQKALFKNSARPPSAVSVDKDFLGLEPDERQGLMDQLRADLTGLYAGPENSGRPALLPPGLTWEMVGHSAVEAALIQQREVAHEEINAIFFPSVSASTSDTVKDKREMAYLDGLAPHCIKIEQAINAQIVRRLLRDDEVYVEFDFGAVLRGSALDEIAAIREGIATGVLTPNEGRTLLNRPQSDVEGADDLFLPRNNLIPLGIPYVADGMHLPGNDDPRID